MGSEKYEFDCNFGAKYQIGIKGFNTYIVPINSFSPGASPEALESLVVTGLDGLVGRGLGLLGGCSVHSRAFKHGGSEGTTVVLKSV